ncbi:MAG: VPLPA-CTERM sorting domain-containing protein, partial [Nitrospira sp.]|nr:VPLPA-CTERM sorting domain-containing protein [Nitrospira sp.]
YSVAIGGERCNDNTPACRGGFYSATFSLRVQPVPLPATLWMMGSALGCLGLLGRNTLRR